MTFMKNAARRLGLITISCFISIAAFAEGASSAATSNHDVWSIAVPAFSVIAGVLLASCGTALLAKRKDYAAARYLAARLAVTLETYSLACANALNLWDTYQITGADHGDMITEIPNLPDYPDGEGWSALKPDLVERALSLRNQPTTGRLDVASFADLNDDHNEIAERCAEHVGVCGHTALVLARDLRHRYDLKSFDATRTFWDIEPTLRQRHDQIVNRNRPRSRSYTFPFR